MPKSTIQPEPIELKRTEITGEGLKLYLLIHWDIKQEIITDEVSGEDRAEWTYKEEQVSEIFNGLKEEIPKHISNIAQKLQVKGKVKHYHQTGEDYLTPTEKQSIQVL